MERSVLTKAFRVVYDSTKIINQNYLLPQTGRTYPGIGLSFAEFDTFPELETYLIANGLPTTQTE